MRGSRGGGAGPSGRSEREEVRERTDHKDRTDASVAGAGKQSTMSSFRDPSLATGVFFIDLCASIEPRVIDWDIVTPGATEEDAVLATSGRLILDWIDKETEDGMRLDPAALKASFDAKVFFKVEFTIAQNKSQGRKLLKAIEALPKKFTGDKYDKAELVINQVRFEGRVFDSTAGRLPKDGIGIAGNVPLNVLVQRGTAKDLEVKFTLPTHYFDGIDWSA